MKKAAPIILVLILVIGVLLTSRHWAFTPTGDINNDPVQEHVPVKNPDPDISEEELASQQEAMRLLEEENEARRREAEQLAAEQLAAEQQIRRESVLEESRALFTGYFYEEAVALLNADEDIINHETQSLENEILDAINRLVLFEGDIKHIFFHSLILYPEVLFPNVNTPTGGINEGFAFQSELLLILPQLLERGYILYSINDIFGKDADGIMRQKDIYLPPGKIPLVLSIDDPSYHYGQRFVGGGVGGTGGFDRARNPGVGLANRVVLDEFGEVATEVITPQRDTIITYDGDVHVVVDAFVKDHPEFSYRGSKGVIAATGYMGIFGYDLPDLRNEETRQEVIAICDKFKENGWLFASHSYSHNRTGFWGPDSSAGNIRWDIKRWRDEIEPIVGQTNLFIAPFGYLLRGEGMQVILDNGFDIYCTVDFNQPIAVHNTHAVMGRIEIGGYSLSRYINTLNRDFFDVASVKDSRRPPILSA